MTILAQYFKEDIINVFCIYTRDKVVKENFSLLHNNTIKTILYT